MEDLCSVWSHTEGMDELKQKLLCTSLELDAVRMEANEEIKKYKENVKDLLNLLRIAYQERDEARDQLKKLLVKVMPTTTNELQSVASHATTDNFLVPAKANSGITESSSLSGTYNHSPVDSLIDAVTSPELSNINNMADSSNIGFVNQTFGQDFNPGMNPCLNNPLPAVKVDPGSAIIDGLAKGKVLPPKGKLLQAVMAAGPLLKTLLVAGPLPRWRNPPPVQTFKVPQVSIKNSETANLCPELPAPASFNNMVNKSMNMSPYVDMARSSTQMCSTSLLNFSSRLGALPNNGCLLPSVSSFGNEISAMKRQRLQ